MTSPPQWYAPLPAGYPRATRVGIMRAEFRTLGVLVPMVLLAEAEAQKQLGGRRGWVKMTYADLAYLTASEEAEVRRCVERWAELGEIVNAEFRTHDFEAEWLDWLLWQPLPPAIAKAVQFLESALAEGERPSVDIEAAARAQQISPRSLDSGRAELGVEATRRGSEWFMSLPREQKDAKDADK